MISEKAALFLIAIVMIIGLGIMILGTIQMSRFDKECELRGGVPVQGRGVQLCLDPRSFK